MDFDGIVREWFYRLPKGYADAPYTEAELAVLNEVLSENGITLPEAKLEKEKFTEPDQMRNEVDQLDQAFNDAEPVNIREALIDIGGKQFQLNDKEIEKLTGYLEKDMKKKDFRPMPRPQTTASGKSKLPKSKRIIGKFAEDENWQEWLDTAEGIISEEKLQKLYFTLYDITSATYTAKYIDSVLDEIYNIPPTELEMHLFSLSLPPKYGNGKGWPVPESFWGIADIGTERGGSKGTEMGRGELIIPLLFKNGELNGANATHDVNINGEGWHVKELKSQNSYIRLGMGTFGTSELASVMGSKVGLSTKEFSFERVEPALSTPIKNGKMSVIDALNQEYGGVETEYDALMKIQQELDREMRKDGIGFDGGQGVIFYVPADKHNMYFVPTDKCIAGGATTGAHSVGMSHSGRPVGKFAMEAEKLR